MKSMAWLGLMTMAATLALGAVGCGGEEEPALSHAERCMVAQLEVESCVESFCERDRDSPFCRCYMDQGRKDLDANSCSCTIASFKEIRDVCDGDLHPTGKVSCSSLNLGQYENMCRVI